MVEESTDNKLKNKMSFEDLVYAYLDQKFVLKSKRLDEKYPSRKIEQETEIETIKQEISSQKREELSTISQTEDATNMEELVFTFVDEKLDLKKKRAMEMPEPEKIKEKEEKPKITSKTDEIPKKDVKFFFKNGSSASNISELKLAVTELGLNELQGYIDRRDFIKYLEVKNESKNDIDQFMSFVIDLAIRKEQEKADRLAMQETERIEQEDAILEKEKLAREEAERKVKEEAERKAKEEVERKAKEEAERKAKEEAKRKAKEEAERKAKEEAERKAKEEAERKAKEEAERKAKEEAVRKVKEEAEKAKSKYLKILAWIDGDFEETSNFEDGRIELAFDEKNKHLVLNVPENTGLIERRTVDRRVKSIAKSGYEFHDLSTRLGAGYKIVKESETAISAALLMEGHKYGGSHKKRPDRIVKLKDEEKIEKDDE